GRPLVEFVPEDSATQVRAWVDAAQGGESRAEFPLRSGTQILQMKWVLLPEIQAGLHMALATDISARAALELQRQQAFQREREARSSAERLSRMKDEFIAVLSHELRTPLTAIRGWVHVLRKRTDDAEIRDRGLEAIERNVALQTRLVSDLLDMSSINLGKMRLTLEDVDPAAVVEGAVNALGPVIEPKALDVRVRFDRPYPMLRADASRLQQVVANLLGNAIKFSEHSGRIDLRLRAEAGGVELAVADQGKGIAADFLPLLFERFSQADAGSNRRQGGLGLGLSIVRHLVESHDGKVSVASPGLGQGSTFTVWLPASGPAVDASDAPLEMDEAVPHDSESTLHGASLLVVDDDPDICAMLQIILGDRGASVHIALDYGSALASLQESTPDLLLSDVGMPGKDGYALIREVRRREGAGQHLPAIALTSYARNQDRDQAIFEGFDAHCAKPVQPLQLVREIRRLIAKTA
ncbi:MAG: ATP-binding protein, partial [Burkholderiaceae bacterium]